MTVECKGAQLPPHFVTKVTNIFLANQPPNYTVVLRWSTVPADPEPSDVSEHLGRGYVSSQNLALMLKLETVDHYPSHPRSYRQNPQFPVLRGINHCRYCLCAPCVIQLPPDFLHGSASPHPANDEKRHRLYRLFWKLLSDVGL